MPEHMIKNAAMAAYGKDELPEDLRNLTSGNQLKKNVQKVFKSRKIFCPQQKQSFIPGTVL